MPKIALITGGNRGLGRATAESLIADGVEVVYTYRTDPGEKIDAAALKLTVGDLDSYPAFVEELKQTLKNRYGREDFDFLVNNAGTGPAAPVAATTVEVFDEQVNTHLKGMFFLTQALLPLIADGGRIINYSTGLTRFVGGPYAVYASMKGAIEVLTRYLAAELGPRGITVNTIAPGPVATEFGGGVLRDNEQLRSMLTGVTALGRMGEAEDVAGVTTALLGTGTGWVNGQRIEIGGGIHL